MTGDIRWRNYVLRQGSEVDQLWKTLFSERSRDVLYILGLGFDERMCLGLEQLYRAGGKGRREVRLVTYEEGPDSASQTHVKLKEANQARLKSIIDSAGWKIEERSIELVSPDQRPIGGRSIASKFDRDDLLSYSDVFVDISALPRSLYFPLISKLLTVFDNAPNDRNKRNLHAVVAHSPALDAATVDQDIDDTTTFLHGFSAAELEREATKDQPRVWLPVLGIGQELQLDQIQADVKPDEICPVLPSPAQNPREGDDLVLAYRELIFDRLRVEPRNIIYASESNPFEVYRQIVKSVRYYKDALAPLGGCKAVISAMSSKLSSLGALLAAYELRTSEGDAHVDVGVAHVEAHGYLIEKLDLNPDAILYTLWLAGECYAE